MSITYAGKDIILESQGLVLVVFFTLVSVVPILGPLQLRWEMYV